MKKILWVVGVSLCLLVIMSVIGVVVIYNVIVKPKYEPGMVRAEENLRAPLDPPATQPDAATGFWAVEENIQLHHFESGVSVEDVAPGHTVLVVHGGPGFPFTEPIASLDSLCDQYRFVYYDQRGCGESTRPIEKFTSTDYFENLTRADRTLGMGAQIADIERIRRLLGEEELILIGHSFGGFIASMYAAEFPERVKAMVLVAPADVLVLPQEGDGLFTLIGDKLPEDMRGEYDEFVAAYLNFKSIFTKTEEDMQRLNSKFGEYYMIAAGADIALSPADVPVTNAMPGWMVQSMYLSLGIRHNYTNALAAVQTPVIVFHGSEDLAPVAASQQYVDAFPNATLKVVEGAGHMVFTDTPTVFEASVREFLDGLDQ